MFRTILVEVTGLRRAEQADHANPGKVKVTYEADIKAPESRGEFYGYVRFIDPNDAPRIGERFTLTLTPA